MRIKSDFVTNSSSSCYVVFVPDNFQITEKMLREEDQWDELNDLDPDEIQQIVDNYNNDYLPKLKRGYTFWAENVDCFWPFIQILENKGLVLADQDVGGGDGADVMMSIPKEKLERIFIECSNIVEKSIKCVIGDEE